MKGKNNYTVVVILLVAVGILWFATRVKAVIIDTDKTVSGNFEIKPHEKLVLKNNAVLSVTGDFNADGEIVCDSGLLKIVATGAVNINKKISCDANDDALGTVTGITIIAGGDVTFGENALVSSNTHLQIVSKEEYLKKTQAEFDALYDETGKDTGTGPRIGPFVEGNATMQVKASAKAQSVLPQSNKNISFVKTAFAQAPTDEKGNVVQNVVISGTWNIGDGGVPPKGLNIPKPPKNVHKIIVNFDFGANGNVTFKDFSLIGPDGRDGDSDVSKNCIATGKPGENAFRMRVAAEHVTLDNFTLTLGNGGKGGDAVTTKDFDPGIAKGGLGGEAGNFKMTASDGIDIKTFHIIPGKGGAGGLAQGFGKNGADGCPGKKGGDAIGVGGDGGKNKKELSATGNVDGVDNIQMDPVIGGIGGLATATPGKGGNGTGCNCNGGKGGKGNAIGGKGGDASVKMAAGSTDSIGGDGGNADSQGGMGGNGGQCPLAPNGGNGGAGGDAKSTEGKGGKGDSAPGNDGKIVNEKGGDGGNGGDGCVQGGGGKGGDGKPKGADGKPGKLECPTATTGTTTKPDDTGKNGTTGNTNTPTGGAVMGTTPGMDIGTTTGLNLTTGGTTTHTTTTGGATGQTNNQYPIQAIQYMNKFLPLNQLIVESEMGCDGGQAHYHAAKGYVVATDGSTVTDPGPQCGYGKVQERPVMTVPSSMH